MNSRAVFVFMAVSLCLVAGLVLFSCGTTNQNEIPNSDPALTPPPVVTPRVTLSDQVFDSEQQVRDWLEGIPCRPPCWQGIVPGQTTPTQALAIVQQLPFVTDVQTYTEKLPSTGNTGALYWKWKGSAIGGGSVSYHLDSTVYEITVAYPSKFSLQDVIVAYGEPSYIHAGAYPSTDQADAVYRLDVLYVSQGFALGLQGRNSVRPDDFGPNWSNFYVYFFEPGLQGFITAWGNPNVAEAIVPWRGMQSFGEYCTGEACDKAP